MNKHSEVLPANVKKFTFAGEKMTVTWNQAGTSAIIESDSVQLLLELGNVVQMLSPTPCWTVTGSCREGSPYNQEGHCKKMLDLADILLALPRMQTHPQQ
jgi:hypothetical protein